MHRAPLPGGQPKGVPPLRRTRALLIPGGAVPGAAARPGVYCVATGAG